MTRQLHSGLHEDLLTSALEAEINASAAQGRWVDVAAADDSVAMPDAPVRLDVAVKVRCAPASMGSPRSPGDPEGRNGRNACFAHHPGMADTCKWGAVGRDPRDIDRLKHDGATEGTRHQRRCSPPCRRPIRPLWTCRVNTSSAGLLIGESGMSLHHSPVGWFAWLLKTALQFRSRKGTPPLPLNGQVGRLTSARRSTSLRLV